MKAFDLTFKYKNWKERELNWKIYYVVFAPFAIPFAILFRFLGLTPNVVTWTSILLQFPVIIFFAMGKPWIALLLMALAQVFDIVDGLLARYTGTSNKLQARFLDHIYHTLGVMAFLIGIGFAVNKVEIGFISATAFLMSHFIFRYRDIVLMDTKKEETEVKPIKKEKRKLQNLLFEATNFVNYIPIIGLAIFFNLLNELLMAYFVYLTLLLIVSAIYSFNQVKKAIDT